MRHTIISFSTCRILHYLFSRSLSLYSFTSRWNFEPSLDLSTWDLKAGIVAGEEQILDLYFTSKQWFCPCRRICFEETWFWVDPFQVFCSCSRECDSSEGCIGLALTWSDLMLSCTTASWDFSVFPCIIYKPHSPCAFSCPFWWG